MNDVGIVGLSMNVLDKDLDRVVETLPAMKKPTILNISGNGWCDVFAAIDEKTVRELIPKLKKMGVQDIVEFPLNKVIE